MEMTFPRLMLVTQSSLMQPDWNAALEAALVGGARLIQLREKDISGEELVSLATAAKELCERYNANLVINSEIEIARALGVGVHLREAQSVAQARAILGADFLVGQSVHSLETARHAEQEGCNYLVFGSVFPTLTHPEGTPAGLEALAQLKDKISIPVLAIGGITPQNTGQCLEKGAHGVAVIRAVWSAPDVGMATCNFLTATRF
jgi:thiamine-phosphate diphosphorylase